MFASLVAAALLSQPSFAIHNNDRVGFYGDSITDNNPWTYYVADWITERFPNLNIYFFNAGMGGDRVTGGGLGPIDQRLTRDLFSHNPTVITIMLGMNDGEYKPFDEGIFNTYKTGYEHIMDRIDKETHARVWLFQPTPYDDVTRAPNWDGGYSGTLSHYSDFVKQLAERRHAGVVDQFDKMNEFLTNANKMDPTQAAKFLPDRVHPNYAAEMDMLKNIILAWGGSGLVSSTNIDWANGNALCQGSTISNWKNGTFDLKEDTLPMWVNRDDAMYELALKASDFDEELNQEKLQVANMPAGNYSLSIDGKSMGTFSSEQFALGIQLEALDTPMTEQSRVVQDDIQKCLQLRYNTWRQIAYEMQDVKSPAKDQAIEGLGKLEDYWYQKARTDAKTTTHHFQIAPAS